MSDVNSTSDYWQPFVDPAFDYAAFPSVGRVLDVGCGNGVLLNELLNRGFQATGVDVDTGLIADNKKKGLDVHVAAAEKLPFEPESFDFVTSKVVLNYTDEVRALAEIARVLKTGGIAKLSMHGLGYYLRYLISPQRNAQRLYGARTILNTRVYRLTKKRMSGWIGDTIYHSPGRIETLCASVGLQVESTDYRRYMSQPVFLYVTAVKQA